MRRLFGSREAKAKKLFFEACQFFNAGDFAAADAAFAQVEFNQLPDSHALQLRLAFYRAFCAAFAGDYESALHTIELVCRNQPHYELAHTFAGRLYYVLGQYEMAVNALQRQTMDVQPMLNVALREHAAALIRAGRLDEALPLLRRLCGRWPELSTWIGQIHAVKACHHYYAGHYGKVIDEYNTANQYGYRSPALNNLHGLARLVLLYKATAHSNFPQAREHLTIAHRDLPVNFAARLDELSAGLERMAYVMSTARLVAKDYATAIDLLRQVSKSLFAPPRTGVLLALAWYWSGAIDPAWQTLTRAPETTQQLPEAQYLAGYLARRLGLNADAYRLLQQFFLTSPDFLNVRQQLAGAGYAFSTSLLETDPLQAIEILKFVQSINPSPLAERALARALFVAGAHALETDQYAAGCAHLEDAIASDDAPPLTRLYLGLAHLGLATHRDDTTEAVHRVEMCLNTWLGTGWNAEEAWDNLLQNGLTQITPAGIVPELVARVLVFYAALLLRQAAADSEEAPALLQRVRDLLGVAASVAPAPTPARFLRGALACVLDHDLQTASDELSAAQAAGLSSPGMSRMLAAASFGTEEYARAIPSYRALLADPVQSNSLLAFYLAYCLWKTGEPALAVDALSPFASQSNAEQILFFYGYLLHAAGQAEAAAVVLEPLCGQPPREESVLPKVWPTVTYEAGIELAQAGKLDQAASRLTQAGQFPDAAPPSRQTLAVLDHLRAIETLREDRFDDVLEYAESSANLDKARQPALNILVSLAHFGQAVAGLHRGDALAALDLLDKVRTGLEQANLDADTPWSAYVNLVQAAALLTNPDTVSQAGELLEQVHSEVPAFAPSTVLCGAYRWYQKKDVEGAMAVWQVGLSTASRAPILWRLLGMGHLHAGRYAEAAEAYASYRAAVGDLFPMALRYQAFCLLMDTRSREAVALLPTDNRLGALQSFLRGYVRFRVGAWSGARADFTRAAQPGTVSRAATFAALAACQVANKLIGQNNLAGADRILSKALQMSSSEIQEVVEQAQARLRRQQGVALLKQYRFKEAADQLKAAFEQGVNDDSTKGALAVACFGLARSQRAIQEMEAAVETLKQTLSPELAACVLIEIGCQQLYAARALAAQQIQKMSSPKQTRAALNPLLIAASESFRAALQFDASSFQVHYLLGQLAYRLLSDVHLAFVHLQQAEKLGPSKYSLGDGTLGDISLKTGQVFLAKRLFFTSWRSQQDVDRARKALRWVLSKEADLLRRFSQDKRAVEGPAVSEDVADVTERAQVLNHIVGQRINDLPADQQTKIRDLWRSLRLALVNDDHSELEKLEKGLLAELGPLLLQ